MSKKEGEKDPLSDKEADKLLGISRSSKKKARELKPAGIYSGRPQPVTSEDSLPEADKEQPLRRSQIDVSPNVSLPLVPETSLPEAGEIVPSYERELPIDGLLGDDDVKEDEPLVYNEAEEQGKGSLRVEIVKLLNRSDVAALTYPIIGRDKLHQALDVAANATGVQLERQVLLLNKIIATGAIKFGVLRGETPRIKIDKESYLAYLFLANALQKDTVQRRAWGEKVSMDEINIKALCRVAIQDLAGHPVAEEIHVPEDHERSF